MTAGLNPVKAARTRAGFTMVEIMFSVLVVGILLGLLIVGARSATRYVKKTTDEQTVRNLAMAVKDFKSQFGFAPPLVKERTLSAGDPEALPMRSMVGGGGADVDTSDPTRYFVKVYDLTNAADELALQNDGVSFNSSEPLEDDRYSVRSLAVYLVGALNVPYNNTQNPSGTSFIPIDGVQGAGFYKPLPNGRFSVPSELLVTSGTPSKRGTPNESMVNVGGSSIKLYSGTTMYRVALTDRNDVPIRYYRWEPGRPSNQPDLLKDLRVPTMVGRVQGTVPTGFPLITPASRDLSINAELRGASWAVVAAGGNKVFGDEPIDQLRRALSMPGESDEKVREEAEKDNIVEVGQ